MSDEELSDEQAVAVEEAELASLKALQEREDKISSVQVGDGGSSGTNWVTVDEDGNILDEKDKGKKTQSAAAGDLSPPRRRGADQSPPRRRAVGASDDASPPRRKGLAGKRRHDSDSDQSPPRARAAPASARR
jgi:hypothetical protein